MEVEKQKRQENQGRSGNVSKRKEEEEREKKNIDEITMQENVRRDKGMYVEKIKVG